LIRTLDCANQTTARVLAKKYLTSTEYQANWDRHEKKMQIFLINTDGNQATENGPVKNYDMVLYFVGMQFHIRTEERTFAQLLIRLGIALGANPSHEQIETIVKFIWDLLEKMEDEPIGATPAKYFLEELLESMGRPINQDIILNVLSKITGGNDVVTKKEFTDFIKVFSEEN